MITCAHCGQPITSRVMFEFIVGGGQRPVAIWTHDDGHHERCANGVTLAEPGGER